MTGKTRPIKWRLDVRSKIELARGPRDADPPTALQQIKQVGFMINECVEMSCDRAPC